MLKVTVVLTTMHLTCTKTRLVVVIPFRCTADRFGEDVDTGPHCTGEGTRILSGTEVERWVGGNLYIDEIVAARVTDSGSICNLRRFSGVVE